MKSNESEYRNFVLPALVIGKISSLIKKDDTAEMQSSITSEFEASKAAIQAAQAEEDEAAEKAKKSQAIKLFAMKCVPYAIGGLVLIVSIIIGYKMLKKKNK
ncbi:MAG: hypothetical protein WC886_06750 [Saccharofermentanaceae bacterium]|jgi:hypothetical protein